MANNARELESSRSVRLAELNAQEKAQAEIEEKERLKNHRLGGGRARFLNTANRKAAELDLGERINRGRQGMTVGKDVLEE
ncbi:hypothetical protein BDD12DRAFT_844274 [Trichophaea hybrida]|nr:hypothetical protein BDD12DRAFT_844274 [Trichophaea hybrida]